MSSKKVTLDIFDMLIITGLSILFHFILHLPFSYEVAGLVYVLLISRFIERVFKNGNTIMWIVWLLSLFYVVSHSWR